MTAEERERMNLLCIRIQQEKDYARFEVLLQDLSDVIRQKELRFPQHRGSSTSTRSRPWKTLSGTVQKIIRSINRNYADHVEISFHEAEDLWRELRFENTFTGIDGKRLGVKLGSHLDVTFEADAKDTTSMLTGSDGHA